MEMSLGEIMGLTKRSVSCKRYVECCRWQEAPVGARAVQTVDCINLVQVTVQPVVNNRVKILQAASVKCIENISACPGLLEPGVDLIRVFQLKQEVWHGGRKLLVSSQFKKICELELKKHTVSRWAKDILDCVCVCVFGSILHLSAGSSPQKSLKRESSEPEPGDVLLLSVVAGPTL